MLIKKQLKNLAVFSVATVLTGVASGAFAHTTIKEQATEGKTTYNALVIGHGCTDPATSTKSPVMGQSVVWPTVNPVVTRADTGATVNLADVISQGTIAGNPQLIQDKNVFSLQDEKTDANGNTIGFVGGKGTGLQTNLHGLVPFRTGGLNFVATSCAKRLIIRAAVADICNGTFPPVDGSANLWMPDVTATSAYFKDANIDGIGAPATLTVNRTTAIPANDATGEACGAGYDVVVTPSSEDIDANLPIPGYWGP